MAKLVAKKSTKKVSTRKVEALNVAKNRKNVKAVAKKSTCKTIARVKTVKETKPKTSVIAKITASKKRKVSLSKKNTETKTVKFKPVRAKKVPEYNSELLKTIKAWNFSDKKRDEFFIKQTLDEYISLEHENKKDFGSTYSWNLRLEKVFNFTSNYLKRSMQFGLKFSYRTTAIAVIALAIGGFFPGALSAPQSKTITTKAQWDAGSFSDVVTDSATDAIQLKSDGSWSARTWAVPPDVFGTGHTSVIAGNYVYALRGYSDKAFYRYDIEKNKWDTLKDLPMPTYYGASMVYDGNGKIYMVFGGYSQKFYSYDIEEEKFTELPELLDTTWTGTSLETDGTDIFVIRGNTSTDFWKYSVAEKIWYSLAPTPATVATGGTLVNGHNGSLYLLRGSNTNTFYRYDLSSRAWDSSVANTPTTGCGGSCTMNGEERGVYYNGYLYFLRSGNTSYFLRYKVSSPSGDTWEVMANDNTPLPVNYASLAVSQNEGYLYVFRSNGSSDFWKFNPAAASGSRWIGPAQLQDNSGNLQTIGTGGDLIWNGADYLYAIRGNNTASVYQYQLSSGAWSVTGSLPYNTNNDVKGAYYNGNMYMPRYSSTSVYIFNGSTWSAMSATLPAVALEGANLAANASGLYTAKGGGSSIFYHYTGSAWVADAPIVADGVTYNVNTGGRMVSNGTDLFLMPGDGETALLKYHSGVWSTLSPSPFAQYYGTDMTYNGNGKILALAGYYKDETWEYTIASNSWRKLANNQKYTYGRGPYQGASIKWTGGNSFYATTGQALADVWSYTAGTNNFATSGTYISQEMDLSQVSGWVSFSHTETTPANTSVTYETRTSSDKETWSSWQSVSNGNIQSAKKRYIQVRATLASSDGVSTPTVTDFTISYNNEDNAPVNATSLNAYSQQVGGQTMTSGGKFAYDHPYFSWPAAADTDSGVAGYYVYFGKNAAANPEEDGSFQSATTYLVNDAMSSGVYYLKIKAEDNNGNISDTWEAFSYEYSGVSPYLTTEKTTQADFELGTLTDVNAASYGDSLRLNSVDGFWNQNRLSLAPGGIYSGGEVARGECKTAGTTSFNGNHCFYSFAGNNSLNLYRYEVETDTWTTSASSTDIASAPLSITYGTVLVRGPKGYLYAVRGSTTQSTLWMYDIANGVWTTQDSAPKNFQYGSNLAFDDARYLYAMPGNDDAFLRYDTCNGVSPCTPSWSQKANVNFNNPNTVDGQKTYEGSDSIYDGRNNIYVMQGNYYPYLAKYSIASDTNKGEVSNTWTSLSRAPVGFYNGGAMAYDSETNAIYALSGKGRLNFFKYDIETDIWSTLPDTPGTISYGASLTVLDGYIYVTRGGNTTGFYKFNIADNTWELPQFGLFGPHDLGSSGYFTFNAGATMAEDGKSSIYMLRGARDNTFGKYDISTGGFTSLNNLPVGAYNGASMAYDGVKDEVYYIPGDIRTRRTGATNYFYKYSVANNSWTEITSRPPVQATAGSSMTFDGSRYLYLTQGGNTTTWWRYDTCDGQSVCTPGWSGALPTLTGLDQRNGAHMVFKDNFIYTLRGTGYNTFFKCDTTLLPSSCWSQVADTLPANIGTGGSLMDGRDGYLYAIRGSNTSDYYRWPVSGGSWETIASIPAQVNTGGEGINSGNKNWAIAGVGTNTWTDGLYSYVVGSKSNGTGFAKTGEYISEPIDLLSVYHWANLAVTYQDKNNTFLKFQTRTSADGEVWSSWSDTTNEHAYSGGKHIFSISSSPEEYIQIKIDFSSSDQIYSPRVEDFAINYYQDIEAPTNPTAITVYDTSAKAKTLTNSTWYNYTAPYFEWPAADTAGGAVDNQGGSGIAGYYVCFGVADDCFDPYVDGEFQTGNTFTAGNMLSGQDYYLKIKAVDNAGMFMGESYDAFTYKFDNTAPTNPSEISSNPTGYSSADAFIFTWTADAADANSGVARFQYRTGGDVAGVWTDISDPLTVSQSVAPYQANKNTFYLRTIDNAGNISTALTMDYFYSGGAASPPQNLTVSPDDKDNQTNSFTFTWDASVSHAGDADKLTYFYSVNYLPTPFNTTETSAKAAGPGPFATQFGKNTMYVVAMNEGGIKTNPNDIDWDHPATVDFYAKTTAPGAPVNMQIFDTSDREAQEYSVAVKWSVPQDYDSGNFAGYTIYRSLDGVNFTEAATTTGTAYVDTELESKLYYYYVRSRDKTNNLSIATSTLSLTPTGRFTTPPTIVSEPTVTAQSFAATFSWSTNRVASSFVEYGTGMSLGKTNGQVDSLTSHEVEVTGLEAATKYYYRVKFIDPDGNIGTSETGNFTTNDPPTIADVLVDGIGLDAATVSWSTNMSGTCTLKYGEGGFTSSAEEASGGTAHIEKITGLKSATQYAYQVECVDADGNSFKSDQYAFFTLEQPRVENLTVQNKENVDIPTIELKYTTTHPTTTLVKFKGASETNYHNYLLSDYVTEHTATIEALDPAIEYEVIATGIDADGVETASMSAKVTTLTDSRPPAVTTNRAIGRVIGLGKDSRANLYVKIETDELTKVKVLFGKGTIMGNFEQSTPEDPANTYHLITIPVDPGQVYSYIIEAVDMADNKTVSNPATVVVEGAKQNATEIVINTFSNKFGWISKLWTK